VDPTGSAASLSAAVDETVQAAGAIGVGEAQGKGKGKGDETAEELRLRAIKLYKEVSGVVVDAMRCGVGRRAGG
jgi:hypothetical protein